MAHPILVQAAWAIVLARMADRTQAIFGATVSGRPLELADADRIFFLNTLPGRPHADSGRRQHGT